MSAHASGAYTGEVAAAMLAELGCRYALCGHSERRQYHGESDDVVARKAQSALAADLVPVACVGETLAEREAGRTDAVVLRQFAALAERLGDALGGMVVAYEPVWAIGTGETATPEDAQELCEAIRVRIAELYDQDTADAVRVLYGGSVKSSNVASIMAKPDVDGALVGGASLDPEEFAKIVRYQSHAVGL